MDQGGSRNAVIEESQFFKSCTILVDKYVEANTQDVFPDTDTSKILALLPTSDLPLLYGALQTLFLRGRCSRTMLELALAHSETSYPEFIQLWIRSLPPNERSRYTHSLCFDSNGFPSIPWDYSLQASRPAMDGPLMAMPAPPSPLGDHRHTKHRNRIKNAAYFFYDVLRAGVLFHTPDRVSMFGLLFDTEQHNGVNASDCNTQLTPDYVDTIDQDILVTLGPVFGINKSDLVFGVRSDAGMRSDDDAPGSVRPISSSERILRTWNILYHTKRLCKTELEDALLRGPSAMRDLLERGATLVKMTHDPHHPMVTMVHGILQSNFAVQANFVDLLSVSFDEDLPEFLECDYCGTELVRKERCSQCKAAMYCNRDCQKKDWKRHKMLCTKYHTHAP